MFNTFPSNSSPDESIFGTSGSFYPAINPSQTYTGPPPDIFNSDLNGVSGYLQDGDYVVLPASFTGTITYFDNTGNQIVAGSWSGGIAHTDIDATCDGWVGFMMDASESLLYVAAVDSALQKIFLATVDAAGTITNIGAGITPTTPFSASPQWLNPTGNGATSIYREGDGAGNIFVRLTSVSFIEEIELNIATGALVTDTEVVTSRLSHYKTQKGNYIGYFGSQPLPTSSGGAQLMVDVGGSKGAIRIPLDYSTNIGSTSVGAMALQWNGRIVLVSPSESQIFGPRAYEVSIFNTWVDRLATLAGLD